jgi:phenylpyruvate tautomerase PptA (4-oxalocrotonate tautomerase family)
MPTFIFHTNLKTIEPPTEEVLHQEIRGVIAQCIGKSEDFVLTIFNPNTSMQFGAKAGISAYCEVKNVGVLSPDTTDKIASFITEILSTKLKISPEQLYIEFQESERHLWGWNGKTFA